LGEVTLATNYSLIHNDGPFKLFRAEAGIRWANPRETYPKHPRDQIVPYRADLESGENRHLGCMGRKSKQFTKFTINI